MADGTRVGGIQYQSRRKPGRRWETRLKRNIRPNRDRYNRRLHAKRTIGYRESRRYSLAIDLGPEFVSPFWFHDGTDHRPPDESQAVYTPQTAERVHGGSRVPEVQRVAPFSRRASFLQHVSNF